MPRKYPEYFYENRPDWVEILDTIKISTKPDEQTRNTKYCGNCKFIKNIPTQVDAYCNKHKVCIKGQWYCKSWKQGDADKITNKSLN